MDDRERGPRGGAPVLARPDMELVGVFAAPGIRTYADLPLVTTRLGD